MNLNPVGGKILHVFELAAALLADLHYPSDKIAWYQDRYPYIWFSHNLDYPRVSHIGGAVHDGFHTIGQPQLVFHIGRCRQQVKIVFPLQPLTYDIHVQQPKKTATETKTKR